MRTICALTAAALLVGCASTPQPSQPPAHRPRGGDLSAQDRANPVGALKRAGASDAITPVGAQSLFGKPDVERRDGAGALLTYKTQTCALALFFTDKGEGLRLSLADASARDQRSANPSLETCVSETLSRKTS